MDLTSIVIAVIVTAAFVWGIYKWKQPGRAADIERLAQSGVRLGHDIRKKMGWTGEETLHYVKNWIFRAAQSYGYKIDVDECEEVARIAYDVLYGEKK